MKYVLDSSVAFKWVVTENLSDKALLVREDYRNSIHELIAPDIFLVEVAHALTRAERQGRIAVPKSGILLADVIDRKSTRLNSSHIQKSRMPSSA